MTSYLVERRGNAAVIAVTGEVDIASVDSLEKAMQEAITHGNVIVDLTRTTFMDSTAIGVIIRYFKIVRNENKTLQVVCPESNSIVHKVINLLGLSNLVTILPSLEQAESSSQG